MGRIRFFQVYTSLVEYYLKEAIRFEHVGEGRAQEWHNFTRKWLDMIPKEDYDFLCFVFQQRYFRRDFGLYDFVAPEHKELDKQVNYDMNFKRLYELEKKFALGAGLIGEGDIDERTKD